MGTLNYKAEHIPSNVIVELSCVIPGLWEITGSTEVDPVQVRNAIVANLEYILDNRMFSFGNWARSRKDAAQRVLRIAESAIEEKQMLIWSV